jgi:hypothetical protein
MKINLFISLIINSLLLIINRAVSFTINCKLIGIEIDFKIDLNFIFSFATTY